MGCGVSSASQTAGGREQRRLVTDSFTVSVHDNPQDRTFELQESVTARCVGSTQWFAGMALGARHMSA